MLNSQHNFLSHFCIAGINYRKSDVNIRGKFSLSQEQCEFLLRETIVKQIPGAFVLSTCNRTEIYGISHQPRELIELLCLHTQGTVHDFIEHGYTRQGLPAVKHLFEVSAGLDSQIIGDYEILSQLKHAANFAREHGCINSFLERIINFALRSSKEIKTTTQLSSGTVSVSYAAIEIIKEKIPDLIKRKILLIGTGKIGNHIAKNVKTYLPGCSLSFCNRTNEKAFFLAEQSQAGYIEYDQLPLAADLFDIIIVSAASEKFIITPVHFKTLKPRLILDLSVPQNVDPSVKIIAGVELMNVDEISAILDNTIGRRKAEVPKALNIIDQTIEEVKDWFGLQLNNPVLRKVKLQLHELSKHNPADINHKEKIHKTVSSLAINLRRQNNKGCQCIHAMSDYLHMN
ncbi:MAG: glutamyl-tRNA reductase [Ginsengibacter sp.]